MFVNQMCMSAIAHGHSDKITEIVNWVAFYFTRHGYDQWIEARGGWVWFFKMFAVIPSMIM